jgi:hypothetical protein
MQARDDLEHIAIFNRRGVAATREGILRLGIVHGSPSDIDLGRPVAVSRKDQRAKTGISSLGRLSQSLGIVWFLVVAARSGATADACLRSSVASSRIMRMARADPHPRQKQIRNRALSLTGS